ncbi:Rpn family recombination-promoting nuclease/putative transposase [Leptospira interrogans]|uniref:Rpn family recombination-promoting nuclease/putative transposase n=1 Tax=Leptospira interrogans TaxID=173 RepID=UPI001F114C5D|nr:Rpn family recombination-promoting nuclease/putative transposase [Leptospira interrogans]UMQ60650.1 Rpn family recombination-promoting nuclease/putative transposase [Leptospira interrogans]UNE66467.1 Rpn family recombination-promoting nuclease/putative transposase [Leptospira interrogans]
MSKNFFPLTNDLMFKILFVKEPDLLISILNSVLFTDGEHTIRNIKILNPELVGSSPNDKRSYLDIRAQDEDGKIFHVEIQVAHQSSFVKRSLYYLSGLIRDQLNRGSMYSDLKPVYQINIVDFDLIPSENFHSKFKFREESNPDIILTDDVEIHFLELCKFVKRDVRELRNNLEIWLYVLKHTSELEEEEMRILVDKTPDLSKAFTILEQYSNDPQKRNELEAKLKSDRDYAYDLAARFEAGELQGIQKGIEKGIKKGIEKGAEKEKLKSARKMLQKGMDVDTILEITGLSKKDLKDHGIL